MNAQRKFPIWGLLCNSEVMQKSPACVVVIIIIRRLMYLQTKTGDTSSADKENKQPCPDRWESGDGYGDRDSILNIKPGRLRRNLIQRQKQTERHAVAYGAPSCHNSMNATHLRDVFTNCTIQIFRTVCLLSQYRKHLGFLFIFLLSLLYNRFTTNQLRILSSSKC